MLLSEAQERLADSNDGGETMIARHENPQYAAGLNEEEAFQRRARTLIEHSLQCPIPKFDVPRRRMFYAIARLGLGIETDIALCHISEVNDQPGDAAMFYRHANIDALLRFGHLYGGDLLGKVKDRMSHADYYELVEGTENHRIMNAVTGYLTAQTWPDWDRSSEVKSSCAAYLDRYFKRVTRYGQGEFDSTTYSVFYINTLATLYDFTDDPLLRKKAGMMIDWFLANTAGDWLNGIFTGAHSRDYFPTNTFTNATAGTTAAWLYFGGRAPDFSTGEPHYSVINALSAYRVPGIIARVAWDRSVPFEHRETHDVIQADEMANDNHETRELEGWVRKIKGYGYISRAGVRKYTYMTPDFAIGSMTDGNQGDVVWSGQLRRWSLDWVSDRPDSALFFNHPFPDFGHAEEQYVNKWQGSSPYEQVVQHKGALIAVYNIPAGETYKYGPRNPFPSDRDPYIDGFFSRTAILECIEDPTGWIFAHGGSVLIAIKPLKPYRWLLEEDGHRRLRSEGLKNGVIVEAASPVDYSSEDDVKLVDHDKVQAELRRFSEAVLNQTQVDASALDSAMPAVTYMALTGDIVHITYDGERSVNGEEIRYDQWPLLGNPFMHSAIDSGVMALSHQGQTAVWDYTEWTVNES